jgi:hypothetical protein
LGPIEAYISLLKRALLEGLDGEEMGDENVKLTVENIYYLIK